MPFVPVNELEKLLVAAATDAAARPAFYRAMLEQQLFIIREDKTPHKREHFVAQKGMTIQIRAVEAQGQPHTAIFSSPERISAVVSEKVGFMGIKGRDLLEIVRGNRLIMNPGSEYGKVFTEQEVESLLDGSIFQPSRKVDAGGKQILLGQPKNYPSHITEPLGRLFAKLPEVKAAYLAHAMLQQEGERPHTLIGVEAAGDWNRVREETGVVLNSSIKPGEIVDLVPVERGKGDTIGTYLLEKTKPFYVRGK